LTSTLNDRTSPATAALRLAALAALFGAILFAHWNGLRGMVALWNGTPMYSFGYIVPFVSAYLLWTRRMELTGVAASPAPWLALPALAAALLVLAAGQFAGVQVAEQGAFLMALVGTVLLLFGLRTLEKIWVALAYLLLMVPFWEALTEPLHLPFQKLSASLGVKILQSVGVPAYHENVTLHLPSITLEVARACSGVNYVIAVLALGIPLGYLYLPSLWRRAVLVVTAVFVAAVSNSLRVALIGVLAYWEIGSPLHGPFHVLHGLFVSGIGYVVLFAGLRALTPGRKVEQPVPLATASSEPATTPWRSFNAVTAGLLAALFIGTGWGLSIAGDTAPVSPPNALDQLPSRLGPWTSGLPAPGTANWWANADEHLRRRYRAEGLDVDVSIDYFASQRQGKELVSNRGDALHRAAKPVRIVLSSGSLVEVNATTLRAEGRDLVALFWYEIDGRPVSGKYRAKWLTLWSTVAHRRSNGAVIVLLVERNALAGTQGEERVRLLAALVHEAFGKLWLRGI